MEFFENLNPVLQALIATLFTWAVTALGALLVCFFKQINKKVLDTMLGFGAGVMLAASFWSLLSPAIEISESLGKIVWLNPALGFFFGGVFVLVTDKFLDKMLAKKNEINNKTESWKRSMLLVSAVTIHNIPEGLAVGVAFGSLALAIPGSSLLTAIMLAVGIGLQNFPEGAAVSLPLRREGYSISKSFFYGQLSAVVEPIAGIVGAIAVINARNALPFLLSFAAGAMIIVAGAELIPESTKSNKTFSILGLILGFIVMMVLDIALG